MELIDKKKLLADLGGVHDVLNAAGDPFLASIMVRAIRCVENQPVIETEVSGRKQRLRIRIWQRRSGS